MAGTRKEDDLGYGKEGERKPEEREIIKKKMSEATSRRGTCLGIWEKRNKKKHEE